MPHAIPIVKYFEYCHCFLSSLFMSLSHLSPQRKDCHLIHLCGWQFLELWLEKKLPNSTNNTIQSSHTESVRTGEFHLFSNTKTRKNVYKLKRYIIQSMWGRRAPGHCLWEGDVVHPGEPCVWGYRQNPHSGRVLGVGRVPGPFLTLCSLGLVSETSLYVAITFTLLPPFYNHSEMKSL